MKHKKHKDNFFCQTAECWRKINCQYTGYLHLSKWTYILVNNAIISVKSQPYAVELSLVYRRAECFYQRPWLQ